MPKCILSGQVKSTFTQEQADGRYIQMTNGATTTLASSLQVSGINNIEFTEEGEESIPASNVSYSNTTSGMTSGNVQNAIDELFQSVSEGKSLIAAAVTDKGVETAATDSFTTMAGNIGQISSGGFTGTGSLTFSGEEPAQFTMAYLNENMQLVEGRSAPTNIPVPQIIYISAPGRNESMDLSGNYDLILNTGYPTGRVIYVSGDITIIPS